MEEMVAVGILLYRLEAHTIIKEGADGTLGVA